MRFSLKWLLVGFILFFYLIGLVLGLLMGLYANFTGGAIAILVMAIIGLSLFFLLQSILISPLRELQNSLQNIGEKHFDVRLAKRPQNEIGNLFDAFNTMASTLQEAVAKLEQDKYIMSREKDKLEVVLSGITDAIIAVDLNQRILIFNSAAETLTGYNSSQVLGQDIGKIIRVFDTEQELLPLDYCPITTSVLEGVVFTKKNLKVVSKNKESLVNLVAGKIKEGANINLGCILVLHDNTEEKRLEEMKLDFVSMAAHELRTPLTSLRGYLSIFIKENKNVFSPEQDIFLSRANIAAQELSALVENLLNVARIESNRVTINIEPVDIIELIQQNVNQFMERTREKKITLVFKRDNSLMPKVLIDKLRISEVLDNLLSNAITYTQEGGTITVWIERMNDEVITHIQDTGIGIPKELIQHLFTKFFRISGRLEQGPKGTGLGLYISKEIVKMHRGKIWAESEVGIGSTFSFSLPSEAKGLVLDSAN